MSCLTVTTSTAGFFKKMPYVSFFLTPHFWVLKTSLIHGHDAQWGKGRGLFGPARGREVAVTAVVWEQIDGLVAGRVDV